MSLTTSQTVANCGVDLFVRDRRAFAHVVHRELELLHCGGAPRIRFHARRRRRTDPYRDAGDGCCNRECA